MSISNDDLNAELLRARDRLHTLETRVTTLELQGRVQGATLDRVELQVGELAKADEIATAVAERLRESGAFRFSAPQRRAMLAAIGIVLANLLARLFGVEGVL